MRLKKHYSAREVAALTGLTARQLQWWDACRLAPSAIASRRTEAGGYTERRYSPIDLYELMVMADLRRRGFSVGRIRQLIDTLRERFHVRLFDAIGEGPLQLLTDGKEIYARTLGGEFYNLLRAPDQPLLVIGGDASLREVKARVHRRRSPFRTRKARAGPPAGPLAATPGPASRRPDAGSPLGLLPSGHGSGDEPEGERAGTLEPASRRASRGPQEGGNTNAKGRQ